MTAIPITLLFGSLTALLQGLLGMNVSRNRGKAGTNMHDTPGPELYRVIRAHGNAAEWIPILLFMLLVLELGGGNRTFLMDFGGSIFLARALHAFGVLTKNKVSVAGASLTYLAAVVGPIYGLYLRLHG